MAELCESRDRSKSSTFVVPIGRIGRAENLGSACKWWLRRVVSLQRLARPRFGSENFSAGESESFVRKPSEKFVAGPMKDVA